MSTVVGLCILFGLLVLLVYSDVVKELEKLDSPIASLEEALRKLRQTLPSGEDAEPRTGQTETVIHDAGVDRVAGHTGREGSRVRQSRC